MKTVHKTETVKPKSNKSGTKTLNALTLLKQDHDKVKQLFKNFEKLAEKGDVAAKVLVANEICAELTVHAAAEEEVFYSAARDAIHDDDMINEADIEHDSAKDLIAQIQAMDPKDDMYDARMKVLSEYIDHHVEEEEGEMFPKARKAKLDLETLGKEFSEKKEVLLSEVQDTDGEIDPVKLKAVTAEAANHKH